MSINWFLKAHRTPIEQKPIKTILFKTLFPNFDTWKNNLISYGIDEKIIVESEFNYIEMMCANSWLRYKTDSKNIAFIAYHFEKYYGWRTKEQELYDLDIKSFLNSVSINEQRLFSVNKTQLDVVTDDYLNGVIRNTNESSIAPVDRFNELQTKNAMVAPKLLFIHRLSSALKYPLQYEYRNKDRNGF